MDIIERAGTRLAVPMQVLLIESNGQRHDAPVALPGVRAGDHTVETRTPGVAASVARG